MANSSVPVIFMAVRRGIDESLTFMQKLDQETYCLVMSHVISTWSLVRFCLTTVRQVISVCVEIDFKRFWSVQL